MADDPQFPPNFKDTVKDTRNLVNSLIDRAALVAGNAGKRWIDGFEKTDAQAVADDIGAKLRNRWTMPGRWPRTTSYRRRIEATDGRRNHAPGSPDVIAAHFAKAAKDAVTAVAQVGMDAFDKVNGNPTATPPIPPSKYKPADALNSLTQLAGAALTGGVSLARVALQVQWDRRVLLVADNVASIVGTGLTDVLGVAGDSPRSPNTKSVKKQQQAWVDAAIQLTNIGALRGTRSSRPWSPGPAHTSTHCCGAPSPYH